MPAEQEESRRAEQRNNFNCHFAATSKLFNEDERTIDAQFFSSLLGQITYARITLNGLQPFLR